MSKNPEEDPNMLHRQYSSSSSSIRRLQRIFCSWGRRRPISLVKHYKKGNPTPLWVNRNRKFYKVFYILNLVSSIIFVFFFIVISLYNTKTTSTSTTTSDTNAECIDETTTVITPGFIIIGSSILFVNAMMSRFISRVEYASDDEWFRYIVINFVCCSGLSGFNIAEYFSFRDLYQLYYGANGFLVKYPVAQDCLLLFLVNLWSNCINMMAITGVCVVQIFTIIRAYHRFFVSEAVFNDEMTAITPCDDIKVYRDQ